MQATFEDRSAGYRDPAQRSWPDHAGKPAPGARYWAPPDASIGDVISAYTNQDSTGFRPKTGRERFYDAAAVVLIASLVAVFGGGAVHVALDYLGYPVPVWLTIGVLGLVSVVALVALTRDRPRCSYVGTEGIALHVEKLFGSRQAALRFEDATSLFISETARYRAGGYEGTDYDYTWRNHEGEVVFRFEGTRVDEGRLADLEDPDREFIRAAEAAWDERRDMRAKASMQKDGAAGFALEGGFANVRHGALEVCWGGRHETFRSRNLANVVCQEGVVLIERMDRKRRTEEPFQIPASEVGDLAVLLRAIERWVT